MTTLNDEIIALREKSTANIPPDRLAVLVGETEKLVATGIGERAAKVGDQFPNIELLDATGKPVCTADLLKQGSLIVSFYRGEWCPYCNLEVNAFQRLLSEIHAKGAQLVAVSPQTPDHSLSFQQKNDLKFEVLSDAGNELARALGLVFELSAPLKEAYTQFGMPLPNFNGDESWTLPIPATFAVDQQGIIRYAYVDADYTTRAEPAEVIRCL